MNVAYLAIAIITYLLGSIPFALIVVRKMQGKDVRSEGTGNVGAMNSYETTGSRFIGISVLVLDAAKGIVSVIIARLLGDDFLSVAIAMAFVVLGHNFSIFIKFSGGRGLATAAGAFLLVNPIIIIFWGLMFVAGWYIIKKNVHIANVTATICAPLMMFYTPQLLLDKFSLLGSVPVLQLLLSGAVVCVIILARHIKPMADLIKNTDEFKKIRK